MNRSILRRLVISERPPPISGDISSLAAAARANRLAPLIVERWSDERSERVSRLVDALRSAAVEAAARDMRQTVALHEIGDLVGPEFLVIKGSALGPLVYGSSELRPRFDVDLWFDGRERAEAAAGALEGAGWRRVHQLPGRTISHAIAMRRGRGERAVDVDLHARCSRRHRVARALEYAPLSRRSVEVEVGGRPFRTLAPRDAWLHSALHLQAHHALEPPPAIMLEDLRRLAARMGESDWLSVWEVVTTHGLVSALGRSMELARAWSLVVPDDFWHAIRSAPDDESERFTTPLGAMLDDLDVLSPDEATEYLAELAFPPANYLYEHYGVAADRPMPILWSYRAMSGLWHAIRR